LQLSFLSKGCKLGGFDRAWGTLVALTQTGFLLMIEIRGKTVFTGICSRACFGDLFVKCFSYNAPIGSFSSLIGRLRADLAPIGSFLRSDTIMLKSRKPFASRFTLRVAFTLTVIALGATIGAMGCSDSEDNSYEYEYCDEDTNTIETGVCEDGICDPAAFEDCGDGFCVLSPDTCEDGYTYEYCDENTNTIETAFCEAGICDPEPFRDCGDGTCVLAPETCE